MDGAVVGIVTASSTRASKAPSSASVLQCPSRTRRRPRACRRSDPHRHSIKENHGHARHRTLMERISTRSSASSSAGQVPRARDGRDARARHLLVEGVPGLAKTITVKTLATTLRGSFKRIPVHARPGAGRPGRHAHLQPEDGRVQHLARAGVRQPAAGRRINRAPAKVQSALLEVMQERQVTIAGERTRCRRRFS